MPGEGRDPDPVGAPGTTTAAPDTAPSVTRAEGRRRGPTEENTNPGGRGSAAEHTTSDPAAPDGKAATRTIEGPSPSPLFHLPQVAAGEALSGERRYRFLHAHARGGLAEVSVALDQELGREVALKELSVRHAKAP